MSRLNAAILIALTIASCAGQPVVGVCPPLPVPAVPDYPKIQQDEYRPLEGMSDYYVVSHSVIQRFLVKDLQCRAYAAEMRATLLTAHPE